MLTNQALTWALQIVKSSCRSSAEFRKGLDNTLLCACCNSMLPEIFYHGICTAMVLMCFCCAAMEYTSQ